MIELAYGPEGAFFVEKFQELARTIQTMPRTYEQDGKGDATIYYLHYFTPAGDWYISELDSEREQRQAFGMADLYQDGGEMGYISIIELVQSHVELDLHFTPKTMAAIRAAKAPQTVNLANN